LAEIRHEKGGESKVEREDGFNAMGHVKWRASCGLRCMVSPEHDRGEGGESGEIL